MKQSPPMQSFISRFHRLAIIFNCEAYDLAQLYKMKIYSHNASFNNFIVLEIVYTQFHREETPYLSFFIIILPYHYKCWHVTIFNSYETSTKLALGFGLVGTSQEVSYELNIVPHLQIYWHGRVITMREEELPTISEVFHLRNTLRSGSITALLIQLGYQVFNHSKCAM